MNPRKWKINLNRRIFMYINLSLPCKGTNILIFVTCVASFYPWVWSVQPPIQSLYPRVRCIYLQECSAHSPIFYSHGCSKFLHATTFLTLADTTFIPMFAMYLPARMFCTLAPTSSILMGAMSVLETCSEPV